MIRVLIVDDHPVVRDGLRGVLDGEPDMTVVGEAGHGAEALARVGDAAPDVVLMDLRMPRVDGVAATRALGARTGDRPAVVVLTTFDGDDSVLAALRAGAAGYLLKHTPPAEIVDAVRRAAAGEPVLSPSVTRSVMEMAADRAPAGPDPAARARIALLSDRERDVAAAVAEGLSNGEIADRLHLSVSSVKAHLSSAMTKLDLTNRTQLAILAYESGRSARPGGG